LALAQQIVQHYEMKSIVNGITGDERKLL